MTWTILSLALYSGMYSVSGDFTNQSMCIKALHETRGTGTEWTPDVRQCILVDKSVLNDYFKHKQNEFVK